MKLRPTNISGYFVSECGKVYSDKLGTLQPLSLHLNKRTGYVQVSLSLEGKPICRRVHILVAAAFIPNPEGKKEVDHIDRNRQNNHADNLRWASRFENMQNRKPYTRRVAQRSLDGRLVKEWDSIKEIAEAMNLSRSSITKCCSPKYNKRTYRGFSWEYIN